MSAVLTVVTNNIEDIPCLRDKALLAFSKEGYPIAGSLDNNVYELSFDDATRNILVLGATGRGKTESVMLPAAQRLIDCNCPGLILDVKGDFSRRISHSDSEKVMTIGPDGSSGINLIGGLDAQSFRALLDNLRRRFISNESYWGAMGVEDAVLVFLFIADTGKEPTLVDIFKGLQNPRQFCISLERHLRYTPSVSEELLRQIESRQTDEFSILSAGSFCGKDSESNRVQEQYSWQTNSLMKIISPFVNTRKLQSAFSTESGKSLHQLVHNDKKVLILDMNVDRYSDTAYTAGRILRFQFMRAVTTHYEQRLKAGYGKEIFSFMLVDEYQQYINIDSSGMQNSLRDDNTWLDRSRGYGHINILATQSITSLLAQAEAKPVESVIQNCQTTIVFPTTDSKTLSRISELSGEQTTTNALTYSLLNPQKIGHGFMHIANHKKSGGASLCGKMSAGTITEGKYRFMNNFIGQSEESCTYLHSNHQVPEKIDNPFFRPHMPFIPNGRVHVLISRTSTNSEMWLEKLSALSQVQYVGLYDLDTRFVPFHHSIKFDEFSETITTGDIVVIFEPTDSFLKRKLSDEVTLNILRSMRQQNVVVLCNSPNDEILDIERVADYVEHTPKDIIKRLKVLLEGT